MFQTYLTSPLSKDETIVVSTAWNASWKHTLIPSRSPSMLSPFTKINILNQIKNTISKINWKMPKKLIFHRGGKVHVDDVQIILQSVKQVFGIEDIEIIEIIKSGHPYVTEYLNSTWQKLCYPHHQ